MPPAVAHDFSTRDLLDHLDRQADRASKERQDMVTAFGAQVEKAAIDARADMLSANAALGQRITDQGAAMDRRIDDLLRLLRQLMWLIGVAFALVASLGGLNVYLDAGGLHATQADEGAAAEPEAGAPFVEDDGAVVDPPPADVAAAPPPAVIAAEPWPPQPGPVP